MWVNGEINGYIYEAKVFDVGSRYGINGGRVSKLWIGSDNGVIVSYDRGWGIKPESEAGKAVLAAVLDKYKEVA